MFPAVNIFKDMKWIDRMETKLGRHAIPGLMRIVVAFNALVFVPYKSIPVHRSCSPSIRT